MRKLILIAIAVLVTFGVFAKGPMTASAPSLADLWGGVDQHALAANEAPVMEPWRAPEPVSRTLTSAEAALEELAKVSVAVAPGIEHSALGIAGHEAIFPAARPESIGLETLFDRNGWITLSAEDSLSAPRSRTALIALSESIPNAGVRNTDMTILAAHTVAPPATEISKETIMRETEMTRAESRDASFRPALLSDVAPVHSLHAAAKISALDLALGLIFAPKAEAESAGYDGDHSRIAELDSLVASRGLTALPEVFTPNLDLLDGPVLDAVHTVEFTAAAASNSFSPEILDAVDRRSNDDESSFRGTHASASIAALPDRALPVDLMNEFRIAVDEHNRIADLAEEAHASAETDKAAPMLPTLDLSAVSPALASFEDHGSNHHVFAAADQPLPVYEADRNTFSRPAEFTDLRALFVPKADILARAVPLPAEVSVAMEPARSEPVKADNARHTAPPWVSSLPPANYGMNIAPMVRSSSAPAPAAKRAATVITGQTTLNVEPMGPRTQRNNFCDQSFIGEPIRFSQTAELTLEDLLLQIHNRFGINFLMGPNVGKLPINIKAGSIPWNVLLRSQLFVSGIRAKCIDDYTIELVENKEVPNLQDTAEISTRFIKLQYLQPTVGGNVNIAGQSSGRGSNQQGNCGGGSGAGGGGIGGGGGGQQSCGNFEKLIIEIEKILGIRSMTESSIGGGGGGQTGAAEQTEEIRSNRSVSVIPGRNILVLRASDDEMQLISEIIQRADRPPFQVVIKGLIYTANETRLRDIGVQPTIFARSADNGSGGIFGHTLGGGGTLFDFSTIIGTVDFAVQATALAENGVISIKSRPFATVLDGETADLTVGRQVPVLIQAQNSIGGVPGTLQILQAANLLFVTPQVIDDEQGNPIAVNLTMQLESNEVDTSVISQGVPSVAVRSIQSRLILNQEQTAILGGFTVDSDSRTVSKTPGLGDIPILGELFKRRVRSSQINRLYFALSVEVVRFPVKPVPVDVPGTDTNPPSITDEMKKRADKAEPSQVTGTGRTGP